MRHDPMFAFIVQEITRDCVEDLRKFNECNRRGDHPHERYDRPEEPEKESA